MTQRRIGILLSYINLVAKNLVTFIYTPILLRFLGQSEYGLYQMANSVITSLLLLNLGLGSAYIRFYAIYNKNEKSRKQDIANLNGMYLILFFIISTLSLVIGVLLSQNIDILFQKSLSVSELKTMRYLMILMVINISISFPSSLFDSYIVAHEQFKFQRSRQLFQTIITPLLTIPLLLFGLRSISIIVVQTAVTLFFFFLNISFATKKLEMKFLFLRFDKKLLYEILSFSFFIFLNQIIDQINWNLPNFLLGVLQGAKQVAIFAVANQIKNIFITLSTTLSGVFVPEINEIVSTTDDNFRLTQIMTRIGRLQMIILVYVLGGFLVLGKYFILVWAGEEYNDVFIISLLLIIPFVITLIQNTGYEIIRAKNMHQFRATIEFLFALLNIFLTFSFIKLFGVVGSAIGTAITTIAVSGFIMNWYYHYKVGLNMHYFWNQILRILPLFIIPTVILYLCNVVSPVDNVMLFVLYGLIYSGIFVVCFYKLISTDEERKVLEVVINKFRRNK